MEMVVDRLIAGDISPGEVDVIQTELTQKRKKEENVETRADPK